MSLSRVHLQQHGLRTNLSRIEATQRAIAKSPKMRIMPMDLIADAQQHDGCQIRETCWSVLSQRDNSTAMRRSTKVNGVVPYAE